MRKFIGDSPNIEIDKFHYAPEKTGEYTEYIIACLDMVCEVVLMRAAREMLPRIALHPECELSYEYRGVVFKVELVREHWDAKIIVTAEFDENQPD